MTTERLLLLEDDASIRRFVALALEDLPVEIVPCATLAQARQALATEATPFALLLTDLMLPDGSGLDLVAELRDQVPRRQPRRVAVFSAGISAAVRERLQALGVDESLAKPVSVAELQACVARALGPPDTRAVQAPRLPAAEQAAVDEFFQGDAALFGAYRQACIAQFGSDVQQAEQAVAGNDLAQFRRLVHSLKTVLRMLGHGDLAGIAERAERQAADGSARAFDQWPVLRDGLRALTGGAAPG